MMIDVGNVRFEEGKISMLKKLWGFCLGRVEVER